MSSNGHFINLNRKYKNYKFVNVNIERKNEVMRRQV